MFFQKKCNLPIPLTLSPLYSRFCPWNLCEMTKNEMKSLCNLLGFWLPNYNFVVSTCTTTNGFVPTSTFAVLTSSINLVYGSTSRGYNYDCSIFIVGVVSMCSGSWAIYGYFSSWPPPLNKCGSSICTPSS